ncbi:hypothetical protein BDV96DRAFT_595982 [Lophiotrema nucula]|uniref:Uncharacterized protein n=1 Tax=Lophiotrema nucula TaxID=690887 RepID=A0A6A5ZK63_9PLEO|nr:hypothetical protein BDV96DRAFT_595982 [Lophiotrema nucula]
MQLSEDNLRAHNATFPKEQGQFQINLIREERALAAEEESYRCMFGDLDELEDADSEALIGGTAMQKKSASEVLKLYVGRPACSETPMSRFMTMSPAQDAQPWTSKEVMHEVGIGLGDLETLDLRKLATEIAGNGEPDNGVREASVGSPRPSSDTLSVSQLRDIRKVHRQDVARQEQQTRLRRRSRQDDGRPK